jgi:tetratricopeptide (TPR) repeat protein
MSKYSKLFRILCAAACAVAVSACQTVSTDTKAALPVVKPKLEDLMAKAGQASASGNKEQAITLWKETAVAFPADKTPWTSIAQTRYDAGQYGEAILAAQEVLVRDPADQLANSIIAISGLRLSTRALADLSRQNNLSGSTRTESQDLAKLLRESLGEQVLVPPRAARNTPAAANGAAASAAAAAGKGKAAGKAATAAPSADPFGALK